MKLYPHDSLCKHFHTKPSKQSPPKKEQHSYRRWPGPRLLGPASALATTKPRDARGGSCTGLAPSTERKHESKINNARRRRTMESKHLLLELILPRLKLALIKANLSVLRECAGVQFGAHQPFISTCTRLGELK